mmetsp:Transcript_20521/g.44812  ORF Transcript_20521/g.44812 Transcript_20521/m.44812 type:complete len:280 (+) Transcript_20521:103-942(+)
MEAEILAEFSSLNALNPKVAGACQAPAASSARRPRAGAVGSSTPRLAESGSELAWQVDQLAQQERLLRGEAMYTACKEDSRSHEHFIEDQPDGPQFGMAHLLPKDSSAEEHERLLRRLEICAKAREESTKIMSTRFAERDVVKSDLRRDRQLYLERLLTSQRDRDERWSRKMQRSPFAVDLVAENQRIDEENRVRDHIELRRQRLLSKRSREAHNMIFKRATAETSANELHRLRADKRTLLQNERQLRALRDVERSNARAAQILQARRQQQQELSLSAR